MNRGMVVDSTPPPVRSKTWSALATLDREKEIADAVGSGRMRYANARRRGQYLKQRRTRSLHMRAICTWRAASAEFEMPLITAN